MSELIQKISNDYLAIPIHPHSSINHIELTIDDQHLGEYAIRIAENEVESWINIDLSNYIDKELKITSDCELSKLERSVFFGDQDISGNHSANSGLQTPQLYYAPEIKKIGQIKDIKFEDLKWNIYYDFDETSCFYDKNKIGHASTSDFVHWESQNDVEYRKDLPIEKKEQNNCIDCIISDAEKSRKIGLEVIRDQFGQKMLHCYEIKTGKQNELIRSPMEAARNLRVWKRNWNDLSITKKEGFKENLRIRTAPDKWPDIRILPAEGIPGEISTELIECIAEFGQGGSERGLGENEFSQGGSGFGTLDLCGLKIGFDKIESDPNKTKLSIKDRAFEISNQDKIKVHLFFDRTIVTVYLFEGRECFTLPVTPEERNDFIEINTENTLNLIGLEVYGLRGIRPPEKELSMIVTAAGGGGLFYQTEDYSIYDKKIEDRVYGDPPAYVPDNMTIISPNRVVEEFVWRDTPWGDMTRVCNRENVWRPHHGICEYPQIFTGWNSVDAACNLAFDIYYRCSSGEFARDSEEDLWSAGFFQGPKAGFGTWVRDTTHVALRTGNLLDPEGARKSLLYITKDGFDNGVDGFGLPIVGIWDYYLATGDITLTREVWGNLLKRADKLLTIYDTDRGLFFADQSTSNDAFPEPENGNYCLSTEIYFMKAMEAMAFMGKLMQENEGGIKKWTETAQKVKEKIRSEYWNEEAGYFTSGPKGTESYDNKYFELSGTEAAVWPKFDIASDEQRKKLWESFPENSVNNFGMNLFPYRKETNHFCNAAWVVWTAGIAAAANRDGQLDFLTKLIAQQVRNCVMTKTFYEVVDFQTGKAWRWPGQLWSAAGFLSYFLHGILGLEYTEEGLAISPAVPRAFADIRIEGLKYRSAVIDFVVAGHGTEFAIKLNGKPADRIPADAKGYIKCEIIQIKNND